MPWIPLAFDEVYGLLLLKLFFFFFRVPVVAVSCGVGCRRSLDPVLLWLWRSRPVAVAPIRPLAWELPYATGAALEEAKRQKRKKKKA